MIESPRARGTGYVHWSEADGDAMYYAARGIAEDDLVGAEVITSITDARLGISAGVAAALTVLREAGWLRTTPEVPLAETAVPGWAGQVTAPLAAWDADPAAGVVLPPEAVQLLRAALAQDLEP